MPLKLPPMPPIPRPLTGGDPDPRSPARDDAAPIVGPLGPGDDDPRSPIRIVTTDEPPDDPPPTADINEEQE